MYCMYSKKGGEVITQCLSMMKCEQILRVNCKKTQSENMKNVILEMHCMKQELFKKRHKQVFCLPFLFYCERILNLF
jgi:hypothetical protein